jgi:hypothetical protein
MFVSTKVHCVPIVKIHRISLSLIFKPGKKQVSGSGGQIEDKCLVA